MGNSKIPCPFKFKFLSFLLSYLYSWSGIIIQEAATPFQSRFLCPRFLASRTPGGETLPRILGDFCTGGKTLPEIWFGLLHGGV